MISDALASIRSTLPDNVCLVAISKYHPVSAIQKAYDAGQRIFGENHVQELLEKVGRLPSDIEWHFTGHLQTNKVKYIAPFINLIHSVDSVKLLHEIEKQGERFGRRIGCLLELHIAEEPTKYGFSPSVLQSLHEDGTFKSLSHIEIRGLMCMATHTDDTHRIEEDFRTAHQVFLQLKRTYYTNDASFRELSMGMSDDYLLALKLGSTMVRIGTNIFGAREYTNEHKA